MDEKYLNANGLAILWGRIQQLVEKCGGSGGGGGGVTYTLQCNENVVSLVGSDGSISTVIVEARTPSCID